jgi:hypothetical protein
MTMIRPHCRHPVRIRQQEPSQMDRTRPHRR